MMHAGNVIDDVQSPEAFNQQKISENIVLSNNSSNSQCNKNNHHLDEGDSNGSSDDVNNEKENNYYIIENADGKLVINKHHQHQQQQLLQHQSSDGGVDVEGVEEEEDYILPVSLLDGGMVMEGMLANNQTIVLIEVPHSSAPD